MAGVCGPRRGGAVMPYFGLPLPGLRLVTGLPRGDLFAASVEPEQFGVPRFQPTRSVSVARPARSSHHILAGRSEERAEVGRSRARAREEPRRGRRGRSAGGAVLCGAARRLPPTRARAQTLDELPTRSAPENRGEKAIASDWHSLSATSAAPRSGTRTLGRWRGEERAKWLAGPESD